MNIRPCDVTSIEARYIDCCFVGSGYVLGSSDAEEVLAVPMHAGITYKEAYEACKEEFHNSSGWFDGVNGSGALAQDALHALFSVLMIHHGSDDSSQPAGFAKYIEEEDDDNGYTVYLYIGLHAED